jgi:hypothetical protein
MKGEQTTWRVNEMIWLLTATTLLRSSAPPVFLEPRHWPLACWDCGKLEIIRTEVSRFAPMLRKLVKRSFNFPSGPTLGELRDIQAMHPVHAALAVASQAARQRWIVEREARFGPIIPCEQLLEWQRQSRARFCGGMSVESASERNKDRRNQ